MKPLVYLLAGSMVANVALGVVWFSRRAESRATIAAPPVPQATQNVGAVVPADRVDADRWRRLSDGTDAEMIQRLRNEGFPPNVLAQIAFARLNRRYYDKRRELGLERPLMYWESGYGRGATRDSLDPQAKALRKRLSDEYIRETKLILRDDEWYSEMDRARQRRDYGDLPPEKVQQIEAINQDYQEIRSTLREEMRGIAFPEDKEKLEYLEKERRADLEKVLSTQELEAYDLRSSDTARSLRSQLARFDPSEEEFKTIYRAQKAYEAKYGDASNLTASEARDLREAEMKAVLSPERFEDYKVKTSGSYEPLSSLVHTLQLPEQAISDVIHLQHDMERRALAVQNDSSLTSDQRAAQLAALANEANEKLNQSLGTEGVKQFKSTQASGWLAQLRPNKPRG